MFGHFMMVAADAVTPTIDLSSLDFTPITGALSSAVPQVLPFIVGVAAIRKVLSFVSSAIYGA